MSKERADLRARAERLRDDVGNSYEQTIGELADALDARDAEIARLREALQQIASSGDDGTQDQIAPDMWQACRQIARTALNGGDDGAS